MRKRVQLRSTAANSPARFHQPVVPHKGQGTLAIGGFSPGPYSWLSSQRPRA